MRANWPSSKCSPSAISRSLLCNGFKEITAIVGTDPMLQFGHTQLPIRFRHRALTMDPFGLDPLEPGTLDRQRTHHHAAAACLLDVPIVRLEPRPHGLADVPRGLVPDQQQ